MVTEELRGLPRTFRAAYTRYMLCVSELKVASDRGVWPSADILVAEQKAFADLVLARQTLLDALFAHAQATGHPVLSE
jgi:hypothetical protein